MVSETDVPADGGRTLRAYDSGPDRGERRTLVWSPGSPHTGAPPAPLLAAAGECGLRLVTYARPSYGASTPDPGRRVRSAAGDTARVADALGVGRFAVMGYSGGGPHALAAAAVLVDRVTAVVTLAGVAPYSDGWDWFAGMHSGAALRSARAGRDARRRHGETASFDPEEFTRADWAALAGRWSAIGADAQRAEAYGPDGLIDDDLALTAPWGVDLDAVRAPVLVVHGDEDRVIPYAHGQWLHTAIAGAELWRRAGAGHVAVLDAVPAALDWLAERMA
jgi:pimeloyl-ACP methyl ester carboxylesterase